MAGARRFAADRWHARRLERKRKGDERPFAFFAFEHDRPIHQSASRRLMLRPRPEPPKRREMEASAWTKASKIAAFLSGAIPTPVSLTPISMTGRPPAYGLRERDRDRAAIGELDGVAEQVEHDLAQAQAVDVA